MNVITSYLTKLGMSDRSKNQVDQPNRSLSVDVGLEKF